MQYRKRSAVGAGGLGEVLDEGVELLGGEIGAEVLRHHVRRIALRDLVVGIDDGSLDERGVLALERAVERWTGGRRRSRRSELQDE